MEVREDRKPAGGQRGEEAGPTSHAGGVISEQSRTVLSAFVSKSVAIKTNRVYDGHWAAWTKFVCEEMQTSDPFLSGMDVQGKATMVALMMARKHQAGLRGKAATSFTAGIRMKFVCAALSASFLEEPVVATARAACMMKPDELRAKRDSGATGSAKLPVCESIVRDIRNRLWVGKGWEGADMQCRMAYLGCMWGFELGARVSEYTKSEPGDVDHCVRTDDLTFVVVTTGGTRSVLGSYLSSLGMSDIPGGTLQIAECRVQGVSTKGKVTTKAKLVARRSPEESEFLDDIILFVVKSGAGGTEELFSCHGVSGKRVHLRARTVREKLKKTCALNGLPPSYFSSQSLRKGAITQMRALGTSGDDRRDRGNYAPNSQVMNTTYDYATGLGPLAANSLTGGHRPELSDVMKLLPAERK